MYSTIYKIESILKARLSPCRNAKEECFETLLNGSGKIKPPQRGSLSRFKINVLTDSLTKVATRC